MDEDAGPFLSQIETDEIKHRQNQDQIFLRHIRTLLLRLRVIQALILML